MLQNLSTAITAMAPAAPQQAGFQETPQGAAPGALLDYSTKEGKDHYEAAVKPIFHKDTKFGVEPANLKAFMSRLADRARDRGMSAANQIGMVPEDANNPNSPRVNIFSHYGQRTLEKIRAYEASFRSGNNRRAQDSKILYEVIYNSLSVQGQNKISHYQKEYNLQANGVNYQCGLCLLKVVIRESDHDSEATVSATRNRLSSLHEYMKANGTDITAFNEYVKSQVQILDSREEQTSDLLINLFKAYKVVKDVPFSGYIQMLQDTYEDGSRDLDATSLMNKAAEYYKKRLEEREYPWDSNPMDERITALMAELKRKAKDKPKSPGQGPPASSNKPSWLTNNEKLQNLHRARVWNNNPYYWCSPSTGGKCSGVWRAHHPSECKGGATSPKPGKPARKVGFKDKGSPSTQLNSAAKKRLKAQQLIMANQALAEQLEAEAEAEEQESDEESADPKE
jgi:hypothetical protein